MISSLLNKTEPWDDLRFPAIKLNNVVFPDPFGPMIPVIEPFLIQQGYLMRTARGRMATKLTYEHLGLPGSNVSQSELKIENE